jgi:tetratricopeptide (TPR) repeat protein
VRKRRAELQLRVRPEPPEAVRKRRAELQLPKRPQDPDAVLRDFQSTLEALQIKLHDAWKEQVPVEARTPAALLGILRDRTEVLSEDERLIFLEMAVESTQKEPLLDRVPLAVSLGESYLHAGLLDDARTLLEPFVAAGVYEREVTYVYGAVLRATGDRAATAALVEALLTADASNASASDGYFLRGLDTRAAAEKARGRHERMRLYRAAREAFDAVIAGDDSVMNTRRFAAEAAIALGDYPAALAYYTAICARTPDAGDHWERILLATRLGDWPAVRASAATLELPVDPPESGSDSDPIDEAWAYCRLRLEDGFEDLESPFETFALRTGPATARGLVISAPDSPQFYQATFLMRPKPLDGDGSRESPYVYPALAVLAQPNYVYFTLDGAAPSDEAWGDLRRAVGEAGGELQRHSGESYMVFVENERVPGIFGTLALPATEDVAAFHRLLTGHPAASGLVWLGLAAAAGDGAAVERQNAQADALGLAD